jgi:hypothetical protein
MISVPFGPNGEPIDPIVPPRPMLFTGEALFVFDSAEEYAQWLAENQPIPPPPDPETDAFA